MEVKFSNEKVNCLRPVLTQVQTQEQTQEVRLPDALPDIGKILGCWGQVLIRGKEWRSTAMSCNGGVMAWVLYAPEDGSTPRVLDVWMPFQTRWDLPEPAEHGTITVNPRLTNLDGRSISARKMILRAETEILAQAMESGQIDVSKVQEIPKDVELLTRTYPVELPVEAGEKQVLIEENIPLPGEQPKIHKLICYAFSPAVTEQKVMTNRLVFRGQGELWAMYMTEDGTIHTWSGEIPFSQYTDLDREHGQEASANVIPLLTAVEMDVTEDMHLQLRVGIAGQYTVFDRKMLDVIEDAYSPDREVTVEREELKLPSRLDERMLEIPVEGKFVGDVSRMICCNALSHQPQIYMGDNGEELQLKGQYQLLWNDSEGKLQGDTTDFSGNIPFSTAIENRTELWLGNAPQAEMQLTGEGEALRTRYPVNVQVYSSEIIPMVTALRLGEQREKDPNRPSIILRRAGEEGIWALAKATGSTVSAIREANRLDCEPEQGQMLLIPVS